LQALLVFAFMPIIYKAESNRIIRETSNRNPIEFVSIETDDESVPKRIASLLTFAEGIDTVAFDKLPPLYSMMAALSTKNRIMRDLIPHAPVESNERKAAEEFVKETDKILEIGDTMGRRFENLLIAPEGYQSGLPRPEVASSDTQP
jgi:hypothetical protein